MADTDDIQGYGQKFENQLELLKNADIPDADRSAILALIRHEDANDTVNQGTMVNHMNRLRLSSERADMPLMEMAKSSVDEFLFKQKHDRGLGEGTLRNYRKALRKFFRHHGREWAEDIEIGSSPDRTVDVDKLLSREEITRLIEAATNPRDKAIIALLADTGLRIGAATSLRLRDVDLSGRAGTVTINEEANVKDDSGPKPLTWSRGYIANWLDVHPRPDEDEAPLFHKTEQVSDDEDGALAYQYCARRLKWIADDADIDRERVRAHNFRKSAISRWIREGLSEQAIKHRAGWAKDSSQFDVYSGVTAEEMNEDILDHYGLAKSGDASSPELEACPSCRTPLTDGARFCPGCGDALSATASEAVAEGQAAAFQGKGVSADGEDVDATVDRVFRAILENDEAREALAEQLESVDDL